VAAKLGTEARAKSAAPMIARLVVLNEVISNLPISRAKGGAVWPSRRARAQLAPAEQRD
jgi:hypothetical protein